MGTSPDIPTPPPAPPAAALPIDPGVLERRRRGRRGRRGSPQTLLTGPQGLVQRGPISQPTLLGGSLPGVGASL